MNQAPHRARKRFGQNFLEDDGVIARIVAAIAPRADDHLVEIGPGQGALTAALLGSALMRLDAIELDRDLLTRLQQRFGSDARFFLHSGDALQFQLETLNLGTKLRIVGNLPYNISTPLLFHLLAQKTQIHDMHFMLQREVVDRLAAIPGSKDWGRLAIMIQYHCRVAPLFTVPPEAFSPAPKVMSAVVRLQPLASGEQRPCSPACLDQVVRQAFAQRRKTLRNTLGSLLSEQTLETLNIDPGARAETLTLDQFIDLANCLDEHKQHSD